MYELTQDIVLSGLTKQMFEVYNGGNQHMSIDCITLSTYYKY